MTKSRSARVKAEIPQDQRSVFLLGPVGSWLLPRSADIWSAVPSAANNQQPSWFIYGSKGCFGFGSVTREYQAAAKIGKHNTHGNQLETNCDRPMHLVALTERLEYIKNDNSRVICCQFCRTLTTKPYAFILTENGSLLLYDCLTMTLKIRLNKNFIIQKLAQADTNNGMDEDHQSIEDEPTPKKLKFSQHIGIISWPDENNAFLSVSMSREKTSYILWLKIPDTILEPDHDHSDNRDLVEFVRINTSSNSTNVVCMETMLLDDSNILIAVGFDDGLINIIKLNKDTGPSKKIVDLKRHSDQICGLSFWSFGECDKHEYSSGLLASVSRDGLVLIWDIENEYYFADYAINSIEGNKKSNNTSNWFGLCFIKLDGQKDKNIPYLAVSNSTGALVTLEIPRKVHASKIRLNGNSKHGADGHTKHRSIIFNASFDPNHNILMTISLDNNLVFWNCSHKNENSNNNGKKISAKLTPSFLLPTMANNARSHMMRFSPIANDLLALALGKAGLRFYKIPSERKHFRFHVTPGCSSVCYEVYKQKLCPTSVAWQPNHEYRLAVATLEGLVLRLDIKSGSMMQSSPATNIKKESHNGCGDPFDVEYVSQSEVDAGNGHDVQHFKTNAIYSLCWGPNPLIPSDPTKLAIYAVGSNSHTLSIYLGKDEDKETKSKGNLIDIVQKMSEKFSNIKELFSSASEVSWKSSLDYMALGTTDGKIIIIHLKDSNSSNGDDSYIFEKLVTIEDIFKSNCIQSLAWHLTTYKDSEYYYYLAVASRETHDIHVFDLRTNIINCEEVNMNQLTLDQDQSTDRREQARIAKSDICLSGHKHSISDISWSPHEENQLCSASFDATNVVWQLNGTSREESFSYHILSKYVARDRLFTAEWSTVDNDLILTSGQDSTVIAWRPSENIVNDVSDDLDC